MTAMKEPKKETKTNIHEGHRERLRTRYKKCGLDQFQPHEVLELLLFRAIPRADTNPLAHHLLNAVGSLYDVLFASRDTLLQVDGIGPKCAELIRETADAARAAKLLEIASEPLLYWDRLYLYATEWFSGRPCGTVAVLLLDAQRKILDVRLLAEEHLRRPMDYAETILAVCQQQNAANVVLMHNHADGIMDASIEDLDLTKYIYTLLAENEITLLEHVIVWKLDAIPCLNDAIQQDVSGFPLKRPKNGPKYGYYNYPV